jgi:site-specific recombinase XerD
LFTRFLADKGMPTAADSIRREHVEAFIAAELQRTAPSSATTRSRSLQQVFRWLDDEEEIASSPMAKMRPPIIPEQAVPVLPDADVKRQLDSCSGREDVSDVGLRTDVVRVTAKGRREMVLPIGKNTARDIDRYIRVRAAHPRVDDA